MKYSFMCIASLLALPVVAQPLSPEELTELKSVKPAQSIVLEADDSLNLRLAKSTRCVPTKRQMIWQQLEFTCFIHFGPNTFTASEWGNGKEDPSVFHPVALDTDQWCRVAKEAGMKMMMITVKHHDGFCTWQTRYNENFSVRSTGWKNGKGDVLKELSQSCKKYGLKLGVYLSPADLYQIENKDGLYGNLSKNQDSVIPTKPESFRTDPSQGRQVPEGKPSFNFKVDDYNRYVLNQLYELLTEYGEIHEVWFDGAHPKRKGGQTYTRDYWSELIRTLAPNAVIAIKGPDVRWCGNEHGGTRESEWSPVAVKGSPESWAMGNMQGKDLGSRSLIGGAGFVHWYPSEVDVSIRHGWFWLNEKQKVRTADDVYDMYERSVGGNAVLLLNVPPNRNGVFPDQDVQVLRTVGQRIKTTYGQEAARLKPMDGGVYQFDQMALINRVVLQEPVASDGQRIEQHVLDAWVDGRWKEVARGTTVGYKKILRFSDITTDKIRVRIPLSRLEAKLSHVSVHYYEAPLKAPAVIRNREGTVRIDGVGTLYYTLDGSPPNEESTVYQGPFGLAKGGVVKAVAVRKGRASEVSTERFDISKSKWKIHHVSSHNPGSGEGAEKAIDGDPASLWHSRWQGGTDPMPHSLTIDLGESLDLKGFTYLPRKGRAQGGILDRYRVELSRDGKQWVVAGSGRFDNIENDPTLRQVRFKKSHAGVRYLKFIGVHSIEGKAHSSAAEIGVITK